MSVPAPAPPGVLLLATGDVLAHRLRPPRPGVATAAELLALVGSPADPEDFPAEPSWDTSPATMLGLARRVRTALAEERRTGVVVTHGVDTLEETAFLTDLLLGPLAATAAVVFTGATRALDAPGGDGPANLAAALRAAADPRCRGLGVLVCTAGELHAARHATLVGTSFTSAPHPPLARVTDRGVTVTAPAPARPPLVGADPEPDVALVKTYPGMPATLLTAVTDAGARGVVLEGTGAGNVPGELLTTISELVEWDVPVVVASRTGTRPTVHDDPHDADALALRLGAISAADLRPAHARVALMAALPPADPTTSAVATTRAWFDRL